LSVNKALGRHILAEIYECDVDVLDDIRELQSILTEAAERSGAEVIDSSFRKFDPYGVSGVVIISESHLTIHTWPEYGYAAVDLFTCGDTADPWLGFEYIVEKLKSSHYTTMEVQRGNLSPKLERRKLVPTS